MAINLDAEAESDLQPQSAPAKKTRKKRKTKKRQAAKSAAAKSKRKRISRNFPASSFEEALEFAKAISRIGSGNPVRRLTLFNEIGKSPESSASRLMITNANRYGLTTGG